MSKSFFEGKKGIILAGIVVGVLAVLLVQSGNPKNMGMCIACFIRDIAGALGLHRAAVVQYIRPEIIGIVLGAALMALGSKEFGSKGGSSPLTRFVLGFFVMVGALMFLGCPLRMVLRLGGGDLNALLGLAGFVFGIMIGIYFLKKGFSLKRNYSLPALEGLAFPLIIIGLLVLLLAAPAFIFFSAEGPGSMHAAVWLALLAGLLVGIFAQKTRLCMVGGIRDLILFKDSHLLWGFIAIFLTVTIGNLAVGTYQLGFMDQPIAHNDGLWNFLGMTLVGWASILLGGCPLRQLIMAGEGSSDSAIAVLGMLVGAAFSHNFGLAASAAGPAANGKIAVVIGLVIVLVIAYLNIENVKIQKKGEMKVEAN
jgi:YedE family putative selenium metabolism protein